MIALKYVMILGLLILVYAMVLLLLLPRQPGARQEEEAAGRRVPVGASITYALGVVYRSIVL